MNWNVRVQTNTDEKTQAVLDALHGLGVEVITGEDEIALNELFYKARINTKLDNLGQLRHLNDIRKACGDVVRYCRMRCEQTNAQMRFNAWFYEAMVKLRGYSPKKISLNDIRYLSREDIQALFDVQYLLNQESNE